MEQIEGFKKLEEVSFPEDFDSRSVIGLSVEQGRVSLVQK
jgi:hypothetical protein